MATYNKKIPKAKESQRGIRDEVSVLDTAARRGISMVYINEESKKLKKEALKDPDVRKALSDFIFGGNEENPLQNITDKINAKVNAIADKKYDNGNMVGIREK